MKEKFYFERKEMRALARTTTKGRVEKTGIFYLHAPSVLKWLNKCQDKV
jgi:hypothetical protein